MKILKGPIFLSVVLFGQIGLAAESTKVSVTPGSSTTVTLSENFKAGDTVEISCSGNGFRFVHYCRRGGGFYDLRLIIDEKNVQPVAAFETLTECTDTAAKLNKQYEK